jgi:hypothetical protein
MMVEHRVDNSETENIGLYDDQHVADTQRVHPVQHGDAPNVNVCNEQSILYHRNQCHCVDGHSLQAKQLISSYVMLFVLNFTIVNNDNNCNNV